MTSGPTCITIPYPHLLGFSGFHVFDGATDVLLDRWYHVAMTYDGSSLKLYVDGELDGSCSVSGTVITTTQPVRIGGGAPAGDPLHFKGLIDEVELFNRALSECEVRVNALVACAAADTTDPVVTVPADITVEATSGAGAVVNFNATANDDVDGAITPVCAPPSGSTFPLGYTSVTCTATDQAGNTGQASFAVTVEDMTPPSVTAPAPLTVECTSSSGISHSDSAVQAWLSSATASDIVDGSVAVSNDASGTCPLGETTINFSATDAAGNTSVATPSSRSTITVEDTKAPVINIITASPDTLWRPNHKMRSVTVTVDVTDACDDDVSCKIVSVTSNEPGGKNAPDWEITGDLTVDLRAERSGKGDGRIYTITVECTDDSGNTSQSSVEVTRCPTTRARRSR